MFPFLCSGGGGSGPITIANILAATDNVGGTSIVTASGAPTSNKLQLVAISTRTNITVDPNQPTVTGAGLTWVAVNSVVYDGTSSSRKRFSVFRALGTASSGALTFDFGGQTQTHASWVWDELSNIDTSGTNGSGAIVQAVSNFDSSNALSGLTATLAAFGSLNNATYGAIAHGNPAATVTVGSGFTQSGTSGAGSQNFVVTEFRDDNDATVDFTSTLAGELGVIGIELKRA